MGWSGVGCPAGARRAGSSIGGLNDQRQAAVGVDLSDGDFEFEQRFDRQRLLADAENAHPGRRSFLECGAAGNNLVDLDRPCLGHLRLPGARAHRIRTIDSTSGTGGSSAILTLAVLACPSR